MSFYAQNLSSVFYPNDCQINIYQTHKEFCVLSQCLKIKALCYFMPKIWVFCVFVTSMLIIKVMMRLFNSYSFLFNEPKPHNVFFMHSINLTIKVIITAIGDYLILTCFSMTNRLKLYFVCILLIWLIKDIISNI